MSDRPPLFRPQATQSGEAGAPLGTRPVSWRVIAALLLLAAGLALGFSTFAGVSRKETLEGYLQPGGGAVRVVAPRDGILARVEAEAGTRVEAGAALLLIENPGDLESGGSLAEIRAGALQRQIAEIGGRLDAEQKGAGLEQAQARARLAGLESESRSLAEQMSVQRERVAAVGQRIEALAPLRQKGFVSEDEIRNREEYLLSLRQGLSGIERQLAENRREQSQARIAVAESMSALSGRLAALRSERSGLEQRRSEAGAEGAQLVRAPMAGRVVALRAEPGQPVVAGAPLLTIAPGAAQLQAILFASPQVVGLVRPGQRVRLMYDAFPVARFGARAGVVTRVSTAAVPVNETDGPTRYRVEVALDRQTVLADGIEAPLQPDMTLKADIVLEKRSLLEWMLQPLLTARARR